MAQSSQLFQSLVGNTADAVYTIHSSEKHLKSPQTSKFFELPPELRNVIYAYVFTRPDVVAINSTVPYVREPAILAVNRQMRLEGLLMFYGENTFQIDGSVLITKFLRTAREEKIRALGNVQIFCKYLSISSMQGC